jgi:thiosulfate/3-mercaptopyruvate sulfurtransferase
MAVGALVSTEWLDAHRRDADLRIVDVRWYLDPQRKGIDAYRAGHIAGAVFLDVDRDLAAPGGVRGGARGRHPWPAAEQVERVMGAIGVGPGTTVVAYDDQAGAIAARLWFLLHAYGHDRAAVLDGGIAKWQAEGRLVDTAEPRLSPASFKARPRPGLVLTKDEVKARPAGALLLDARAPERYRGETEPIDPRAGHIPGAANAPFSGNLTSGPWPTLRSPDELRERYAALGAAEQEPIVYCGSGVTACHDLLALHVAGLGGRLYAGSWSEWSSDPASPVETGEPRR